MIAGLLPYSAYKESGAIWFGDLPTHWGTYRLGAVFAERGETNERKQVTEVLSLLKDIGVIPYADKGRIGNKKSDDIGRYKIVRPEDLVLNSMNVIIGSVGASKYTGCLSPVYYVLKRRDSANNPRFLELVFQHRGFQQSLVRIGNGILAHRMRIPMEKLKAEVFPLPPPDEQAAIVGFLDWANGRLERAIRAKRKVIALLNEQKQAIIHRAVTRGLDPDVPLKPSGIPWLGDIPQHWEVRRLKSLGTKFGSGVTPRGGASVYQDSGIPLLRSQNIHFDGLRLGKVALISPETHAAMSGTHVKPRDVLLNITGASIGRVCAVPGDFKGANVNQHVCIIRPILSRCDAEYLAMFLATEAAQTAIYIAQNGSSREGLAVSAVKALPIVLPPLGEQQEVAEQVQSGTRGVRDAISRLEREIELLREYRTRLVADVVTGKLDVREAAARLPDEAAPDMAEVDTEIADELDTEAEDAAA